MDTKSSEEVSTIRFVACDLGAESSRVILGTLYDGHLTMEEIHRFPTPHVVINGGRRWDPLAIYADILVGLKKCAEISTQIVSISFDSWGVDYVLLKGDEPLLSPPYHYRDPRTDAGFKKVFQKISKEEIFAETGIQFMTLNTLYQCNDDVERRKELLYASDGLLLMADYFNWLLCGQRAAEVSLASTTQIYNPRLNAWSKKITEAIGFPSSLLPPIVPSGTPLGALRKEVAEAVGLPQTQVVATCSHDTGAAVAAVPSEGDSWAYLSSGTWSLLGVELSSPHVERAVLDHNFTNEAGYGGTTRFLKNIVGLWIVQELRRAWQAEGKEWSYAELTQAAEEATPLKRWIHPADPRFAKPGDMSEKISAFCRETSQSIPQSPGEFVRCVLESLALLYRSTLEELEILTERPITVLHIVGGGSRNHLLNQMAASATGRIVKAGPVEATAIGNILIQSIVVKKIQNLKTLRQTVRDSFPIRTFQPEQKNAWDAAYQKFCNLPCAS